MENRAHALIAGIFLLLLGAALAGAAVWFQGDTVERVNYTVVSRTGVSGLNLKAPVKLRGVLATICPADKKLIHGMKDAILVHTAATQFPWRENAAHIVVVVWRNSWRDCVER